MYTYLGEKMKKKLQQTIENKQMKDKYEVKYKMNEENRKQNI